MHTEGKNQLQSRTVIQELKEQQKTIFYGMPSLLNNQQQTSFVESWPCSLIMPKIPNVNNSEILLDPQQNSSRKLQRPGKNSRITACQHTHLKPFAKSMCYKCYQKKGRLRKAYNCEHTTRANYAKGLCQMCYLQFLTLENQSSEIKGQEGIQTQQSSGTENEKQE